MIQPEDVLLQSAEAILQISKSGENDALTKQGIIVALGDFFLAAQKVDPGALIDAVTGALAAAERQLFSTPPDLWVRGRSAARGWSGDDSQGRMKSIDPREAGAKPPYSDRKQAPPGREAEMSPPADHGESSYVGAGRLEGRRALITGGDSGIGRAVALAFAREGADVAVSYLSEEDDARETLNGITEAGRKGVLLPGDIGDPGGCENVAKGAIKALGGIDILVNNAAFQRSYEKFEDIPEDEFEEAFRVNVFAMFRLCKKLLPQMPKGASIINTASIQSFDPGPQLLPYAATKAAIASFTSSLAGLAIKHGVRVNAVAPGPVWTPLIPSTLPAEKVKTFGADTVFGRAAQPAELAPLFVFLASDQASYVSGEIYGATGGRMPL